MKGQLGRNTSWELHTPSLGEAIASGIRLGQWWSRIAVSEALGTTARLLDNLAARVVQDERLP